jgi:hypothetical protein
MKFWIAQDLNKIKTIKIYMQRLGKHVLAAKTTQDIRRFVMFLVCLNIPITVAM